MNSMQILIITSNRSELLAAMPGITPENSVITSLDSLNYIGFSHYKKIVIDCASVSDSLKKVSLGIRDDQSTQALWQLLASSNGPEVYLLIEKMERPGNEMKQLGIQYITAAELQKMANSAESSIEQASRSLETDRPAHGILTADDIRDMHQSGLRQLPAGSRLTSWAAEVADSLNFHSDSHALHLLFPVKAASKKAMADMRTEIFALSSKFPNMLFIVNEAFLPVFNSLFPSLQGKTVAPSVHWESHGAYTGETSVQMLVDQRCFGAIIPARKPYTDPANFARLQKLAQKNALTLFSTFTLASAGTCDIIASNKSDSGAIVALYPAEALTDNMVPGSGAIVVNSEFLKQSAFSKGN